MSNDMASEPTAKIPAENLPLLQEKITKLNKVADKLGLDPITLTVGEPEYTDLELPGYPEGIKHEVLPVTVVGEAPRVNGWEFAATLEHDENGTIIRRIPNFADEVDLSQYRNATPENCDHCGYKRRRNDTYIVVSETGETKQVGSNCLKDFTGHENPQAVARYLESLRDFIENLAAGGYHEGRVIPRYSLEDLVAIAVSEIRRNGYVSRAKAHDSYGDKIATAENVRIDFFARLNKRTADGQPLWVEPTEADFEKAAKVIEFIQNLTEEELANDFLYNVFVVYKTGTLTDRQFGIAAAGVLPYDRAHPVAQPGEDKPKIVQEFLGEPKGKVDVTFTVQRVFENHGDYGVSYKHIALADTGHRLVWSTGAMRLEEGKTYRGTFSVKDHRETQYGKETLIFRPKKGDPQEV